MRANNSTRKLVLAAMYAALAYIVMIVIHIQIIAAAPFLTYDPKDVILGICGFTLGPVPALMTTVVVTLLEMITVSSTGPIGCLMNLVSSASFVLPAAVLYARRRTLRAAAAGLTISVALAVIMMLLWNYFITPLYMGTPREVVAAMLLPVFLPFNLIKAALNAAITMLVYKPVSRALRRTGLLGANPNAAPSPKGHGLRAGVIAALVLVACIVATLILSGRI